MTKKWGWFLAAIIISCCLAYISITPPRAQGPDAAVNSFSSSRAMVDLREIAAAPHPTGSVENAKVRAYLQRRLTSLGLEVELQKGDLGENSLRRLNRWSGGNKTQQSLYNVIGVRRGSDPSLPALLLMAHHDTVWASPGAADDTIGIASILEVLRAINQDGVAARDIIVLFTDAEELGLVGAETFFARHPLKDHVGAVINLEARGGGGTANLFQTSKGNGALARNYARRVKAPSASSLSTFVYEILPNDTDLTPVLKGDYIAYNIANIGKAQYYHSPKITPEAIDEATLQHMGAQTLELTRSLITWDGFPEQSEDAVFFDVYGLFMLVYAPIWGWGFLVISVLSYVASVNGRWRGKDILIGSTKMIGFLAGGAALLYGLNMLSGHGAGANYYDRLAAIPKLEVSALLFITGFSLMIFGRNSSSVNMRFGAALPLLMLGVAGQIFAPTATYFITLPLMVCGIGTWAAGSGEEGRRTTGFDAAARQDRFWRLRILIIIITSVLTTGYMLSLGHLLMVGVGPDLLSVAILPACLAILSLLPLQPDRESGGVAYVIMFSAIIVAIGFALWVRLDPLAVTIPPY